MPGAAPRRRLQAEMREGGVAHEPPARRALDEPALQQIRLDHVLESASLFGQRRRQGLDAHRPASVVLDDARQIAAIEGIEAHAVHLEAPQRGVGRGAVDGLRAGEVDLDGVQAGPEDVIGAPGRGLAVVEGAVHAGIAAVCAEASGVMAHMHRATVEYLKHREQFGTALSNFQALQHKLVDMYMACELSHSMACMAAVRLMEQAAAAAPGSAAGEPADAAEAAEERRRALSAAKVQIGQAGRFVGENAIQLHGGMGMTDEMPISHYFKRLTLIDSQFGDADHHLQALAGTAA